MKIKGKPLKSGFLNPVRQNWTLTNIMHFASHKGAKVYAILASLVETCRMCGQSVMRYLVKVIHEVNDGNKDYDSLIPGVLAL